MLKDTLAKIDWADPNVELDPEVEQFLRANVVAHAEYLPQFVAFCVRQAGILRASEPAPAPAPVTPEELRLSKALEAILPLVDLALGDYHDTNELNKIKEIATKALADWMEQKQ